MDPIDNFQSTDAVIQIYNISKKNKPSWKVIFDKFEANVILQIFGIQNLKRVEAFEKKHRSWWHFNSNPKIADYSKQVTVIVHELVTQKLAPLHDGTDFTFHPNSQLGKRSAFHPLSSLPARTQSMIAINEYLSVHPFPVLQTCLYGLHTVLARGHEKESILAYSKRIQTQRIAVIEELYWILGPRKAGEHIKTITREKSYLREMCLLHTQASLHEQSWRACITKWRKAQKTNAADFFLNEHYLSRLLDEKEEGRSERSSEDYSMELPKEITSEDSFQGFMIQITLEELLMDLLSEKNCEVDAKIEQFSAFIEKEENRYLLISFVNLVKNEYLQIPRMDLDNFNYEYYKNTLKKLYLLLERIPHVQDPSNSFELLLVCLLMIHFTRLEPRCGKEEKLIVLAGLLMINLEDKQVIYKDWLQQESLTRNELLADHKDNILTLYPFEEQREGFYILIKSAFRSKGLQTKTSEETFKYSSTTKEDLCKLLDWVEKIARQNKSPGEFFQSLLYQKIKHNQQTHFNYVYKVCESGYSKSFFLPPTFQIDVAHLLDDGKDIRSSSPNSVQIQNFDENFIPCNNLINYLVCIEKISTILLPYIHAMLPDEKEWLNVEFKRWVNNNEFNLHELQPSQRVLWINAEWRDYETITMIDSQPESIIVSYYVFSVVILQSLENPDIYNQFELTLNITRERLENDTPLQNCIRIFATELLKENSEKKIFSSEMNCLEDLNSYFSESLKEVWRNYKAPDKKKISAAIFQFFYNLKLSIRQDMLRLGIYSIGEVDLLTLSKASQKEEEALIAFLGAPLTDETTFKTTLRTDIAIASPDTISISFLDINLEFVDLNKLCLLETEWIEINMPQETKVKRRSVGIPRYKGKEKEKEGESFSSHCSSWSPISPLQEKFQSMWEFNTRKEELDNTKDFNVKIVEMRLEEYDLSFRVAYPEKPTIRLLLWQFSILKSRYLKGIERDEGYQRKF